MAKIPCPRWHIRAACPLKKRKDDLPLRARNWIGSIEKSVKRREEENKLKPVHTGCRTYTHHIC